MAKQKLKDQVEAILKKYPDTRNSDIALTIAIWKEYYPSRIKVGKTGEEGIWLKDLYDLPREDNVKRVRATFNAAGQYYPTDWKVAKGRGIEENQWRIALGYPPRGQTILPTRETSYTEKLATPPTEKPQGLFP